MIVKKPFIQNYKVTTRSDLITRKFLLMPYSFLLIAIIIIAKVAVSDRRENVLKKYAELK